MTKKDSIRLGVIGYGYWGPNLVRNFLKSRDGRVVMVADTDLSRLETLQQQHPTLDVVQNADELIANKAIDAVAIATPVASHFRLARAALRAGKHVLVEKPITACSVEAAELVRLAKKHRRILMVDHTFIYTGAVQKLRSLIDAGQLGDVLYYDSVRVSLGLFQNDLNVLWDLAPHDLSIMSYLLDKQPVAISAVGSAPIGNGSWRQESVVYVTVYFEDNLLAHFHLNWLSPVKVRKTLIGGNKRMIVYDGLELDNQIKVYDKGVEMRQNHDRYEALVQYRIGDLLAPKVDQTEALERVCFGFLDSIKTGQPPLTDGEAGLRVVRMIEAAQESMRSQTGARIPLNGNGEPPAFVKKGSGSDGLGRGQSRPLSSW